MMKATIFLLTILGLSSYISAAGFVFTGDAKIDFANPLITARQRAGYLNNSATQPVNCGSYMTNHVPKRFSGLDIDAIHMLYDDQTDSLHIGVQCNGICGDTDGDGNPSAVDPNAGSGTDLGTDTDRMCTSETMSIMTWAGIPDSYKPTKKSNFFFPNIISGVTQSRCLTTNTGANNWFNWQFNGAAACPYQESWNDTTMTGCGKTQMDRVTDPSGSGYSSIRFDLPAGGSHPTPDSTLMFNNPNSSAPSIEWTIQEFSKYPGNDFTAGGVYQPGKKFRVGISGQAGSPADSCGEDTVSPRLLEIVWDCNGYPNGESVFDDCGICDGDGQSCLDCSGTPNGTKNYDPCGNCAEEADFEYHDACGLCGMDGVLNCLDCSGTPNGTKNYDPCGNCAEEADFEYHDVCGLCGMDGVLNCLDCSGAPNGTKNYDPCGNCAEEADFEYHDVCGLCGMDGVLNCLDCSGTPNGTKNVDACGNCVEPGVALDCLDCSGTPNGTKEYDNCGICNEPEDATSPNVCGNCDKDLSCIDCLGVPNGTAKYDSYGVCNGFDYHDCFNNPHGNATYDSCGVCGGDDSTCNCYKYFGYEEPELSYALLRWSVTAARVKVADTLAVLEKIREQLPHYDYKSETLNLASFVDSVHTFCDDCLDNFDSAQVWFADRLAGNCVGAQCEELDLDKTWHL